MKQTGMLVVSLRGVNFGCLISLKVSRVKGQFFRAITLSCRVTHEEIEKNK